MTISERIFELMKQKNISQIQFAELTGIGQSTISDWKRKKTNPSADKIMTICNVLEVSPEYLLSGTEQRGRKSRRQENYVINKDSDLGMLVSNYEDFSLAQRNRLLGYMDALREMEKKGKIR